MRRVLVIGRDKTRNCRELVAGRRRLIDTEDNLFEIEPSPYSASRLCLGVASLTQRLSRGYP